MRDLTRAEAEAVVAYAKLNGRTWKHRLMEAWMRAGEPGLLQSVRNSHGPSWLRVINMDSLLRMATGRVQPTSEMRESRDGYLVWGEGFIADVSHRPSGTVLECWHVEVRDAEDATFTCFAVFPGEAPIPHVEEI